jgi:hypothetical protein
MIHSTKVLNLLQMMERKKGGRKGKPEEEENTLPLYFRICTISFSIYSDIPKIQVYLKPNSYLGLCKRKRIIYGTK